MAARGNSLRTEIHVWPRMENCLRAEIRPWPHMENGLRMENCLLNAQGAWKRYAYRIQMERERYEES